MILIFASLMLAVCALLLDYIVAFVFDPQTIVKLFFPYRHLLHALCFIVVGLQEQGCISIKISPTFNIKFQKNKTRVKFICSAHDKMNPL